MQIAACMVASDSVTLRKLALEFAALQLTSQPHTGALYNVAMHLVKAGKCHCMFLLCCHIQRFHNQLLCRVPVGLIWYHA